MYELIEKKIEKEVNCYIYCWDDEKIFVENGCWGLFICFKCKNVKIFKVDGECMILEVVKDFIFEQVKVIIEVELFGLFKEIKKKMAGKKVFFKKKMIMVKKKKQFVRFFF